MKVLYVQERINLNGSTERLSSQFDQPEILIGRGGASHVILTDRRVSLVHAKFLQEEGVFYVSDLNSLSGVRVNTSRVSRAKLATGDIIHIADIEFAVDIAGDLLTLTRRVAAQGVESSEDIAARNERALQIESYIPRMRVLSLASALVVVAGWFAYPLLRGQYHSWSSGKISIGHKVIEGDCQRCHASPFERVQDRECLNCHTMTEHAKGFGDFAAKHSHLSQRCAACHMEHNGENGLIVRDSRPCVSCHGRMNDLAQDASILDVVSFDSHPQFRVSGRDRDGKVNRISLDDTARLIDETPLKLNHAVHLKAGLRGPHGPQTLQCKACHQLSPDKREMTPISFEKDCRQCHSLGFDERLPDVQVPHANAEGVYSTLFAEYAKLILVAGNNRPAPVPETFRAMPQGTELPPTKELDPDVRLVQLEAREAEKDLFTRTGCFLCHNYREKPQSEWSVEGSRYMIEKPNVPHVWMPKASFNHGAHEEVSCESCHENARKSKDTSDVLLPSIKTCRECHVGRERTGFVTSDCVQCHSYHKALEVPREKKIGISEYIHSLSR